MAKYLRVTMSDGSRWDVPVWVIARNRAKFYADEFDGDVEKSLQEDTLPLFEEDPYEISDWASDNMYWSDVADIAQKAPDLPKPEVDYQQGWANGKKEVVSY